MTLLDALTLVGAITGLMAFSWNLWSAFRSYLLLSLDVRKPEDGAVIIKASVANSALTSKRISFSALVITPQAYSLLSAMEEVDAGSTKIKTEPDLFRRLPDLVGHEAKFRKSVILIPLTEFYGGQSLVGPTETVSYACSLDIGKLQANTTYIVRFFVFVSYAGIFVRWRFTADAFHTAALTAQAS